MFEFLFGSKNNEKKDDAQVGFIKVKNEAKQSFIVLHKTTQEIIGVFDSLEKAKEQGQKATCSIYSFKTNGNCKYLNTPIYEDS